MTDTASLPTPRSADLPATWWAPALTLTERLAAPGLPDAAAATGARGPMPWAVGDAEGFALRLDRLGVDGDTAAALAAEPAERLAERTAKPDWASFAEEVLAAAPDGLAEVEVGGAGPDVFAPVVRPLVATAAARFADLTAGLPDTEATVWRDGFTERLTRQLVRQAARTLVQELHAARRARRLAGAGPRERFVSFAAAAGTRRGLADLFAAYPVLARMLTRTALDATQAAAELAARFQADRSALATTLLDGRTPDRLVRVDLGRGDAHQGNRSVAILHFADGSRLVHKPRPLDQHALLDHLVAWLNAKVPGLGLRTPRTLRRDAYGWLEFIEHRWCTSVTETDAFYRRQGALLALLYAVDGADMHYENVIAHGDQPVLVDAETLLHTGLGQALTAGADPAADALAASVHRTCLLPHLLIGEHGALDISALGRDTDGTFPSEGLRWEDSGQDTMRAVRGPLPSPAAQNHPLPHGTSLSSADHTAALLGGFRTAYTAIAAHRRELLDADGPLVRWTERPARLIARATRLYATLLEESTHPALLSDALAREGVFAVLWTESAHDTARERLIEHETAALWRGDIPFFTHRPTGTAVHADDGTSLPGVLPVAAATAVRDKLGRMDEVDCHDQEWIISATLAVRGATSPLDRPRSELTPAPVPPVAPEPSRLLAAACGIADEITARAVRGGSRANWIGLERVSGAHWAVLPMGAGLAQGYCGVALFLAHTEALTGSGRYGAAAREAVRPLPALLKALAEDPELSAAAGPGGYDGLGGIVYTLVRLAQLLDENLRACLPDALTALGHATAACSDPGLAQGRAGALAAAVAAYEATGDPAALRLADRIADLLATAPADGHLPATAGLADGTAGIVWALRRWAGHRPERAAGVEAAARALLDATPHTGDEADLSWAHGLAGQAAAGLTEGTGRLANAPTGPDLSLAQGALGRLDALAALAEQGDTTARSALRRHSGHVLALVEAQGHRCATPDHVPSPALMTGLAGIGYGLLRLADPDAVPSVLLLHHPDH
ncbi:type 2 lantipeptide synthetase LanM [Streptomyces aquilus]|uniref:Type 2 lantipeptide synthetase LanM n=1 Tax=Streptomyces aquilus TaxID=2548456 RepID=A0A3S9IE81_9ACTN|nr:type 2 lanthipeptide synthetase LanM family protein [Streptomyces aquilus]AZP22627.1 type 2 lantipeptide synthetase LanM [Streptomyces aquilus]